MQFWGPLFIKRYFSLSLPHSTYINCTTRCDSLTHKFKGFTHSLNFKVNYENFYSTLMFSADTFTLLCTFLWYLLYFSFFFFFFLRQKYFKINFTTSNPHLLKKRRNFSFKDAFNNDDDDNNIRWMREKRDGCHFDFSNWLCPLYFLSSIKMFTTNGTFPPSLSLSFVLFCKKLFNIICEGDMRRGNL